MKVMHLIHGLSTGGAETLVKDYALKLDKSKFEVVVLCFKHFSNSPYEKILYDNNIRVIYVSDFTPFKNTNNFFAKVIKLLYRFVLIKKIIKKENPDILHTHLTINAYVKFARIKKECKIYHSVHSEPTILWRNTKMRQYDLKCAKYLVKHNNMRFIVLHNEMKKEIDNLFGVNNSIVLNNGIDFSRFSKGLLKDKKQFRKELSVPQDAYVVGHVGRFSDAKNHKFLVDVFNEISKNNTKAFLLLVGDGKYKNEIEKKLKDLGLKDKYLLLSNRGDVPDLLGIMDIFVFPSIYEGLGIVLIEAQKMNLPCFISDKVPKAAEISNIVTRIPLSKSAKEWTNIIKNYKQPKKIALDDKDWDMDEVVKKLETIYFDNY